jgi:hypothetical protein
MRLSSPSSQRDRAMIALAPTVLHDEHMGTGESIVGRSRCRRDAARLLSGKHAMSARALGVGAWATHRHHRGAPASRHDALRRGTARPGATPHVHRPDAGPRAQRPWRYRGAPAGVCRRLAARAGVVTPASTRGAVTRPRDRVQKAAG